MMNQYKGDAVLRNAGLVTLWCRVVRGERGAEARRTTGLLRITHHTGNSLMSGIGRLPLSLL